MKLSREFHLVVFPMYASVAEQADSNALLQGFSAEMPFEMGPTVHLFGDQVMKGERHSPLATGATLQGCALGLYDAGNAASIAALISFPLGLALLGKCPRMAPDEDTTYLLKFQLG